MRIKREKLLHDLHAFTSLGNGVIIGSPGVGKTYLLKELCQSLDEAGMPYLFLPVDQLGDGTEESLRSELSYDGDLIEWLKSLPTTDSNATLFFDAFDAARNEDTRQRFLRLIRRAIQELTGLWNVIVTVRTYDAKKSQELLDLFGNIRDDDRKHYHIEGILCRHLAIPVLTQEEIQQAFDQIPHLKSIYESATEDFKNLLTNPFNLWLLKKILIPLHQIPDFSQIFSEVQLLDLFWQRRIEAPQNEAERQSVLAKVTRQMVEERSLSVRQETVYSPGTNEMSTAQTAWDDLLSDEILAKVSSTRQRIAFSHNILFDYAISVLQIEDDPKEFETFVHRDLFRPVFLRPSLTYFLTRLWYNSPKCFWDVFWHVLPSNRSVHLRLFARLIPTSVIANEARTIVELEPLMEKLRNGEKIGVEAIVRLLQARRSLQVERDSFWIGFFDRLLGHLHIDFAWEFASQTSEILERARARKNIDIIKTCGCIGRCLLGWVWRERIPGGNDPYSRIGSSRAVPIVAKTFSLNVEESRCHLRRVLTITQEDNFPVDLLMSLSIHVDEVWAHDPDFVVLVYRTIFTHHESSKRKTDLMLSGPVLSLTSTRSQDYGACQYQLIMHFPKFLRDTPSFATQAAIQSLNYFIATHHIVPYVQKGVRFEDLTEEFKFRGKSAYYVEDHSYIWDEREYRDEPIEIADELFGYIEELAASRSPGSVLESILDIFRDEVCVAFFWKRLLKTATKFPEIFAPRLHELCTAKPLLIGDGVIFELGTFIETAATEFNTEQILRMEDAILALPKESTHRELPRDTLMRKRDRLIARIPLGQLQTQDGMRIRDRMEQTGQLPENEPPISFESSVEPFSEEDWLQKRGVDTTAPENQPLQRFLKPLENFVSQWKNQKDSPPEEAVIAILPILKDAYATITGIVDSDSELIDSTWNKLGACAAILAGVANETRDDLYAFCREVLLHCADHELPNPDPRRDAQFSSSGYSPSPRHEAAQGLIRLAIRHSNEDILNAIEALAGDPVPSVRMVTIIELPAIYVKSSQRFWKIVENRATYEDNRVVKEFLHGALTRVVEQGPEEERKTTQVLDTLLNRARLLNDTFQTSDAFTTLLFWLAIHRDNSWASKTIEGTFLRDTTQYPEFFTQAVSYVMRNVKPEKLHAPGGQQSMQACVCWLERIVDAASTGVQELCIAADGEWNDGLSRKLRDTYRIIDKVIVGLYFNFAHKSNGSEERTAEVSEDLRCQCYNEVEPLMSRVIAFALGENGVMFARTSHHFMQLLTFFLPCDPQNVLKSAADVATSSKEFGYNLDSLAVAEVVKFVEIVLADYRSEAREGQALDDLVSLLDVFAEVGWSEALRVVWRLDEVFR